MKLESNKLYLMTGINSVETYNLACKLVEENSAYFVQFPEVIRGTSIVRSQQEQAIDATELYERFVALQDQRPWLIVSQSEIYLHSLRLAIAEERIISDRAMILFQDLNFDNLDAKDLLILNFNKYGDVKNWPISLNRKTGDLLYAIVKAGITRRKKEREQK